MEMGKAFLLVDWEHGIVRARDVSIHCTTSGSSPTWMKKALSAVRRSQWQSGTLGEAFTDDGIKPVVNFVLVLPQQLHHWVVRPAEDTRRRLVACNLA